jgi:glycosyltransferase involved in cell wall biosynthesis
MRLVILSETFSPKMGYIQNALPKFLAKQGADVHLVTEDLPPYYQLADFKDIYGEFTGRSTLQAGAVERVNGFTLHVLGHRKRLGYMQMVGLMPKMKELRPRVVQVHAAIGWLPLQAAFGKAVFGYRLFTGSHTSASVFPPAQQKDAPWNAARIRALVMRGMPGRVVSWSTEKCYGATVDCADVAIRFFGVEAHNTEVCPLGIDTDVFRPICSEEELRARRVLREELGFTDGEIVCIYSGRFADGKDPLILARAVEFLRKQGLPFRGLFLGAGGQRDEIAACDGCVLQPFVPFTELRRYFQAAEIGVWPKQESMSMLDAAACGIPIVVNDTIRATERIEGNGLTYRCGDVRDLTQVLLGLQSPERRHALGSCGARRMREEFSWEVIARRRLADYEAAVNGRRRA